MPNPSPMDDLMLFRHISSGELRWYPKSYLEVPELASDLVSGANVSGVQEVKRNLVNNPSPALSATNSWIVSSITVTQSADWSANPSGKSFKASTNGAGSGDFRIFGSGANSFPVNLEKGKTYTMQATIYRPEVDPVNQNRSRRILLFVSTNGSTYTEVFGPQGPNDVGVQTLTHTFTIPTNATGIVLGVGVASSAAGIITYIDNVMIEEGEIATTYFDGGFTQDTSYTYEWSATPYNSYSRKLAPVFGSYPDVPREPRPTMGQVYGFNLIAPPSEAVLLPYPSSTLYPSPSLYPGV